MSTTTYTYNGDGDRVSQTVNGSVTRYAIDVAAPLTMVLAETSGTETTYYLHGLDLAAQQKGTLTQYLVCDGLGSVRQVLNSARSVLFARLFDPYGNPYLCAGNNVTNFGFSGEQTDPFIPVGHCGDSIIRGAGIGFVWQMEIYIA